MGQAGAQREPSMEEILASIRRIIENNEPAQDGGQSVSGDANGHPYDDHDSYSDDRDSVESDEIDQVEMDEPAPRPISLADVAALARAIPDQPQVRAGEPVAEDTKQDAPEFDDAAEELRDALMSDEPVEAPEVQAAKPADAEHYRPATQSNRSAGNEQAAKSEEITKSERDVKSAETMRSEYHQAQNNQESTGQLVSLHTGEKVAASFGELDAAIAAGQSRSFDEIAEEMLRPMLTQWLDDNLPTLVERLVREEIERVSRGSRR